MWTPAIRRTSAIFQKSFYAWTRLPTALFFTFAFPLLFLTVFALAFHHGVYSPEPTLDLAVENQDHGLPQGPEGDRLTLELCSFKH